MAGFMASASGHLDIESHRSASVPHSIGLHDCESDEEPIVQPCVSCIPWPEDRPSAQAELVEWGKEAFQRFKYDHDGFTWLDWLKVFVPGINVLMTYNVRQYLVGDVVAGLTVGAMLVPQSLSYAKLAGLPSVFGLYGGFIPLVVYAFLGSSRQLGVGPVAVTSLLLGSGIPRVISSDVQVNPNNPADPLAQAEYNQATIQVTLLAGLMYTAAGLLGLGWITNFLSHAVISGFMTGAAIVIGLAQVKYLFGYTYRLGPEGKRIGFPRADSVHEQLANLFSPEWLPEFHWPEMVMGLLCIIFILSMRKIGGYHVVLRYMSYFASLTTVIFTTALVAGLGWYNAPTHISVVGDIPAGLPGPTVSLFFPIDNFGPKILLAAIVCLIDMLESISIARALAMRHGYELNATSELRGLGVANLVGACLSCYTTTGSFSRSSVNSATGAQTQMAGLISALVIMVVLLVATPLFRRLPLTAMAAVIISALPPLFNYQEFWFLWRVNKFDCLVFTLAFLGTLFLGVELGLLISVSVSLLIVVFYAAFPHISVMGHLPGTNVYRNLKLFPEAREVEGFLILRVDAPIFFANLNPVAAQIDYMQRRARDMGQRIDFLVLDLAAAPHLDGPAVHFLRSLVDAQAKKGVQVVLVHPNHAVIKMLMRSKLDDLIGRRFIGMNMHAIIQACQLNSERDPETLSEAPAQHTGEPSCGEGQASEVTNGVEMHPTGSTPSGRLGSDAA